MGHTFTNHLYHVVFSTKGRRRSIASRMRDRLFQCIGGIARENKGLIPAINGTDDHICQLDLHLQLGDVPKLAR